jgi:hypothetical protein
MNNNIHFNDSLTDNETEHDEDEYEEHETDDETEETDDDETEETDDDIYEHDEVSLTKYNIVVCEKYNSQKHGYSYDFGIENHYLTHYRLKYLKKEVIRYTNLFTTLRLEIAECIILPSHHSVSILKTFWLKIIQRKWKKIYKIQQNIIKLRSYPKAQFHRQIFGKWPNNCLTYPGLKGML